ncbi:acyl-CoA thioesterase [Microbacterium indicum]|uniref:acyl-CoA thioesterase n=1 Tax=Microbacterium indicum TaxID=358100 RepID=UPI0004202D86|nr:acyl-CoA thioesterase II [Microbacterium indicum]
MAEFVPPKFPVDTLTAVLNLEHQTARTSEDIFVGRSHPMPNHRVFGGQVVAQCVTAAARTLPGDRAPHSMHGYFLRPGATDEPITFGVDRIHDGRSFAQRRVQAYQQGVPIFSGIVSFQDADPGISFQRAMPDVPGPDEVRAIDLDAAGAPSLLRHSPIEVRYIDGDVFARVDETEPRQRVWMRTRGSLGDDPLLHRAAIAYMSDWTIQDPTLRGAGVPWATPGIRQASLDHAIWWHRDARADEWLLYATEAPSAQGGRGLNLGTIHTLSGEVVATTAQETMLRVPGA